LPNQAKEQKEPQEQNKALYPNNPCLHWQFDPSCPPHRPHIDLFPRDPHTTQCNPLEMLNNILWPKLKEIAPMLQWYCRCIPRCNPTTMAIHNISNRCLWLNKKTQQISHGTKTTTSTTTTTYQ
jgi:hypothetical protein